MTAIENRCYRILGIAGVIAYFVGSFPIYRLKNTPTYMRFCVTLCFIFLTRALSAQEGYKIDLKIKGLKDTTAYLGFYLQENFFVKDTAQVDGAGNFSYAGSKTLPQGVYFIILHQTRIFDLVVGPDQRFSLETSTEDYVKKMVVTGDDDNKVFFESSLFESGLNTEAQPFISTVKDSTLKEEEKKKARQHLTSINEKVTAYRQSIIEKYPLTLTARMMKAAKPIHVPDPPKKPDGSIDSTFQLRYYREHFFDNYNLGDEALLRLPKIFYWEKVNEYLTRLFVQHPDSLTKAIDGIVAVAKKNKDTYRFLVWKCLGTYQQPEIMGLDEVYVNLVDKYIATGEMDYWLDKKTIQNIKDYANKVRRAMIGRTAPNLIMQNENLQPRSLYDIKAKYTLIFFFKPTCGHCREEAPKLVQFYNSAKKKFTLEVFAVSTDTSMKEMKEFIHEMKTPWTTVNGPRSFIKTHFSDLYYAETTPTIYILDERKKIIARKLAVDQLSGFFENHEKFTNRKAALSGSAK
jgi:peroxiredoxin